MNSSANQQRQKLQKELSNKIGSKERRKLLAQKKREHGSVLFGLGMFGMVGWAVAIPTLFFLAIGIWIDSTYPGRISWTLIFLFVGVVLGCINAWYWVSKESQQG